MRSQAAQVLPLDLPAQHLATTELEREAQSLIRELAEAGRLNSGHRLLVALVIDLARAVGMSSARGQAAGAAMASKQLMEAMAQLPELVDQVGSDDWGDLVAALRGDDDSSA